MLCFNVENNIIQNLLNLLSDKIDNDRKKTIKKLIEFDNFRDDQKYIFTSNGFLILQTTFIYHHKTARDQATEQQVEGY